MDICFPCIFPEVREEDRADKRAELMDSIRERLRGRLLHMNANVIQDSSYPPKGHFTVWPVRHR